MEVGCVPGSTEEGGRVPGRGVRPGAAPPTSLSPPAADGKLSQVPPQAARARGEGEGRDGR